MTFWRTKMAPKLGSPFGVQFGLATMQQDYPGRLRFFVVGLFKNVH